MTQMYLCVKCVWFMITQALALDLSLRHSSLSWVRSIHAQRKVRFSHSLSQPWIGKSTHSLFSQFDWTPSGPHCPQPYAVWISLKKTVDAFAASSAKLSQSTVLFKILALNDSMDSSLILSIQGHEGTTQTHHQRQKHVENPAHTISLTMCCKKLWQSMAIQ